MKITTIAKETLDTDKMSDVQSEMVELLEKSGIRDFSQKHGGFCYIVCGVPNCKTWSTFHLDGMEKMMAVIRTYGDLFFKATGGMYTLAVLPMPDSAKVADKSEEKSG